MDNRIFSVLGAAWLLLSICVAAAAVGGGGERIKATLDRTMIVQSQGKGVLLLDQDGQRLYPIVYEETVYLPVEAIGEKFNAATEWDKENNVLHIGGNPFAVTGGIPEAVNSVPNGSKSCFLLDVDGIEGKTRVEALALTMDEGEITVNVGGRQKTLTCFYGNESGAAFHAVVTNMDTGEIIMELDSPKREKTGYQTLEIPVEGVSRIRITAELSGEEEKH